jgi:hypothetical protein
MRFVASSASNVIELLDVVDGTLQTIGGAAVVGRGLHGKPQKKGQLFSSTL